MDSIERRSKNENPNVPLYRSLCGGASGYPLSKQRARTSLAFLDHLHARDACLPVSLAVSKHVCAFVAQDCKHVGVAKHFELFCKVVMRPSARSWAQKILLFLTIPMGPVGKDIKKILGHRAMEQRSCHASLYHMAYHGIWHIGRLEVKNT